MPTEVGKLEWDGACWGEGTSSDKSPRSFYKYMLNTGDSVVKKERQGPCPPRTHHQHGEAEKYSTGCMIRAVKRQVQGAGRPQEIPDPAWVEGIRKASRRR